MDLMNFSNLFTNYALVMLSVVIVKAFLKIIPQEDHSVIALAPIVDDGTRN